MLQRLIGCMEADGQGLSRIFFSRERATVRGGSHFPFSIPLEVGPLNPARGSGGAL